MKKKVQHGFIIARWFTAASQQNFDASKRTTQFSTKKPEAWRHSTKAEKVYTRI